MVLAAYRRAEPQARELSDGQCPRYLAAFLAVAVGLLAAPALAESETANSTTLRLVERVIDGDTLVLEGGERVRLIGVDTPETVHPQKPVERFGKEASEFTRGMVEGERVRLEYEQGMPTEDRYGRTLGYVYLEDGTLLNLEIIERGYGHAYTRFPFSKMEGFRAAERHAREVERGLWADEEDAEELEAGGPTAPFFEPEELPDYGQPWMQRQAPQGATDCVPRSRCCRVCSRGQACGNSCISASYICRRGRGCACNHVDLCK